MYIGLHVCRSIPLQNRVIHACTYWLLHSIESSDQLSSQLMMSGSTIYAHNLHRLLCATSTDVITYVALYIHVYGIGKVEIMKLVIAQIFLPTENVY